MDNIDKKKQGRRGQMPSAPIKAPARNVKGIGRMGTFEGGLRPGVINPNKGASGSFLVQQIIGPQGGR